MLLWEKEKYPEDLKEPNIELHVASATRRHMLNFFEAIDKGIRPLPILSRAYFYGKLHYCQCCPAVAKAIEL